MTVGATKLDAVQDQALVEEFTREKKIPVVEIFGPTIQGEGPLAGAKTMFVRTGGCDYRCSKCDSLHAVIPAAVKAHAKRLTSEEIVASLLPTMEKTGTKWVTLSGGNPCMWDFTGVVAELQQRGYMVMVETQGTLCPEWLRKVNMVTVSPKSPGMGEKFEPDKFRNFLIKLNHQVMVSLKIVIFSQQDIDFALEVGEIATDEVGVIPRGMRFFSLGNPYPPRLDEGCELTDSVMRSVLIDTLLRDYRQRIEEMTMDRRVDDWRFLPQLHVLAFGNEAGR